MASARCRVDEVGDSAYLTWADGVPPNEVGLEGRPARLPQTLVPDSYQFHHACGQLVDRRSEGGQPVRSPTGLLDIVKAYDAKLLRYDEPEFMTRCIHEAASDQVRSAEDTVRARGACKQGACALSAAFVARSSLARDENIETLLACQSPEGLFPRQEAGRTGLRRYNGNPSAARPAKGMKRGLCRRGIVEVDVIGSGQVVVAIDQDHPLAAIQAGPDYRVRRSPRKHHRCVGAVVEGLAQRMFDISRVLGYGEHHRNSAGILQMLDERSNKPGLIGRIAIGDDQADDAT